MLRAAALDQRGGVVEAVEEPGAGGVEVDDGGVLGAEPGGDGGRQAGGQLVGRDRRDQHVVDFAGLLAGIGECGFAGLGGEFGQRLVALEPMALADPGAPDDPLIARVEPRFELGVRHDLGWEGVADAKDSWLHETGIVRLTSPVRIWPGPSSMYSSTPSAWNASSVSRQRTGRSRFSASSRRGSMNGATLPFE